MKFPGMKFDDRLWMWLFMFFPVIGALLIASFLPFLHVHSSKSEAYPLKSSSLQSLPSPRLKSAISLEEALKNRRSVRAFSEGSLSLDQMTQLLWAAQGITHDTDHRTTPSAGALYPLEVYVIAGRVTDLPAGIYHYQPMDHRLDLIAWGDHRASLSSQAWVAKAPGVIVITGVYERTRKKYGDRAERYVHLEAGAAAENALLQAVALNLGSTFVGAFDDTLVKKVLNLPENEQPLAILPVGRLK